MYKIFFYLTSILAVFILSGCKVETCNSAPKLNCSNGECIYHTINTDECYNYTIDITNNVDVYITNNFDIRIVWHKNNAKFSELLINESKISTALLPSTIEINCYVYQYEPTKIDYICKSSNQEVDYNFTLSVDDEKNELSEYIIYDENTDTNSLDEYLEIKYGYFEYNETNNSIEYIKY